MNNGLPEPSYFTVAQLAERWGCDCEQIALYIFELGLRPAFRPHLPQHIHPIEVVDVYRHGEQLAFFVPKIEAWVSNTKVTDWVYLDVMRSSPSESLAMLQCFKHSFAILSTTRAVSFDEELLPVPFVLYDGTAVNVLVVSLIDDSEPVRAVYLHSNAQLTIPLEEVCRFEKSAENSMTPTSSANALEPVQRSQAMQTAILDALAWLSVESHAIPKNQNGKPGVRAQVRARLEEIRIDVTESRFRKAWQALRNSGEIRDA